MAEPFPAALLARSRVSQILWAFRGQRAGLSLYELSTKARSTKTAIRAQIAVAQRYLARVGSAWEILAEQWHGEFGETQDLFWLTAPHCPRPAPRAPAPPDADPEIISWEELEETYPILPRWELT